MSDQPCETPLLELARNVPKDFRGEWESMWAEDGTPIGHSMAPVGRYIHELADEIERLQRIVDAADLYVTGRELETEDVELRYAVLYNLLAERNAALGDGDA